MPSRHPCPPAFAAAAPGRAHPLLRRSGWGRLCAPLLLVLAAVLTAPSPLCAQEETPPQRNGNIWDSIPHQPRETEVAPEERALGVAPSIAEEKALNEELDTIGKKLLEDESTHPPHIPPPPPGMN